MDSNEVLDSDDDGGTEPRRTIIHKSPEGLKAYKDSKFTDIAGEIEPGSVIVLEHDNSIMVQLLEDGSNGKHIGDYVRLSDIEGAETNGA